jgi:hypothetical protein
MALHLASRSAAPVALIALVGLLVTCDTTLKSGQYGCDLDGSVCPIGWVCERREGNAARCYSATGPHCGDGVKNGSEMCDGQDHGTATCATVGFCSGTLLCRPDCTGFDTSGCTTIPDGGDCGQLSSVCAFTPLASTCVEAFFERFLNCFYQAGDCGHSTSSGTDRWCWAGDAVRVETVDTNLGTRTTTWTQGGLLCLTETTDLSKGSSQYVRESKTLTFDPASGIATCPNGMGVQIGSNWGACPQIQQVLTRPACIGSGTCP